MEGRGLTRKEKLELWRAKKGGGHNTLSSVSSSSGNDVLARRPGAGNGTERPASRKTKESITRQPFQVDMRVVREASERRVAPGTPIHSLKKRLKRPGDENAPAQAQDCKKEADHAAQKTESANVDVSASSVVSSGATAAVTTRRARSGTISSARSHTKAMVVSSKVSVHANRIRRSMDTARTKEVSEFLKSQISEANLLLEISGVDAARTLLADLLFATGAAGSVGELALYWAARAKLEEDAEMYNVARQTLDEGQAYISIPTQQKVLEKVCSAFEDRMNNRAEKEVAQLLEDSVDTLNSSSGNSNSTSNSHSPTRYDPNELSVEDEGNGADLAIKNLNFSKVVITEEAQDSTPDNAGAEGASGNGLGIGVCEDVLPISGASAGVGGTYLSRMDFMQSVICSDDDSDTSIGDIDEAVIARAKAFNEEEEARKVRMREQEAISDPNPEPKHACKESRDPDEATIDGDLSKERSADTSMELTSVREVNPGNTETNSSMPPPQTRNSKKRKGTPHPKPRRDTEDDAQAGTFMKQVESKGKDGKRTLTPVRRSRRISGSAQEPTPSPLRKEMEAML